MDTLPYKIKIAERFKKARIQQGMSQQDLADELGLLRPQISYIEGAYRSIRAEELGFFCGELGVTVEWLVG